jgi:hypothetical protein
MDANMIMGLAAGISLTSIVWYFWMTFDKHLLNYFARKQKMNVVPIEKQIDKSLMNVLRKKITFEEYLKGRIEYFFSWRFIEEGMVFLILLSVIIILFGYTNLTYTQREEAIAYEAQATLCNGRPVLRVCPNAIRTINYSSFSSPNSSFNVSSSS